MIPATECPTSCCHGEYRYLLQELFSATRAPSLQWCQIHTGSIHNILYSKRHDLRQEGWTMMYCEMTVALTLLSVCKSQLTKNLGLKWPTFSVWLSVEFLLKDYFSLLKGGLMVPQVGRTAEVSTWVQNGRGVHLSTERQRCPLEYLQYTQSGT